MKPLFRNVYVVKPESSRASSSEAFVIGVGYLATSNLQILSESLQSHKQMETIEETKEEED
jgi:hypothetical protein